MPAIELELTVQGYLAIPYEVVQVHFPEDTLVALMKGPELWLMPTHSSGGGGMLLKQCNAQGDRSVLMTEILPPGTPSGRYPAFWDSEKGALRMALEVAAVANAVSARASIEEEAGRWVVYLEAAFWEEGQIDNPKQTTRHRIADYSTAQEAEVAARWMERGADKSTKRASS